MCFQRTVLFLLLFILPKMVFGGEPQVAIVPKPQMVKMLPGKFPLNLSQIEFRVFLRKPSEFDFVTKQLQEEISHCAGKTVEKSGESKYRVQLGVLAQSKTFEKICRNLKILPEKNLGEQGYILLINPESLTISANTKQGLFYGVQTAKQLIRSRRDSKFLPCLKIIDWPDLRYRGVQDDISRGPIPTLVYMKEQVRRISEMKLNLLSYYVENVVKTKFHPDFAPADALTVEEWKELSRYAAKYFVDLMGNFQSLGHFEKILAYPQYRHLGTTDRMLSPVNPESFRFLQEVYSDYVPAFHFPVFCVDCDETWDLGRGDTQKLIDSLGVAAVYTRHLKRLGGELKKHHKRMMIWADVALQHPQVLDLLPRETVLGAWDYSAYDSFTQFMLPLKKAGFDFMFSPGVLNSNRLMPDYRMTFTNIRNFVRDGKTLGAMGMLNTVWDDGGKALFSLDWYGVAFGADQAWNWNEDSLTSFNHRFDLGIYGDSKGNIAKTLDTLTRLTNLAPTQEMNEEIFWKMLIPARGEKLSLNPTDWDEIGGIARQALNHLDHSHPVKYRADLQAIRFTAEQYQFLAEARQSILGAASNYRHACLVEMNDHDGALMKLLSAKSSLETITEFLEKLKIAYQKIWRLENREYWLDHVVGKYEQKIAQLRDARTLLTQAIYQFKEGKYVPPPNEVRLAIEETSAKYFQYWLLCGPFPNIQWQGRSVDYLTSLGGEQAVRPRPGLQFKAPQGEEFRWQKYASPRNSQINLAKVFEENTEVLAYAYCEIESPSDQEVSATLGSNDGIVVFCNGKKVFHKYAKRSLIPDEDECRLSLVKGKNRILLKIDQNKGGWGFSFRLPDVRVRNHKYKYRIIE